MNIFIIFGFLIFAAICFKRLNWGLYLILFFLPTYLIRFKIGFLPFTFLEGMILILAVIWLFKKIKNKQLFQTLLIFDFQLSTFKWPILLFFIAAAISVFVSSNRLSALGDFRAFFIEPLIFFVIFLDLVKSEKEIKNVFYVLGGSAIYISLFAICQIFTGYLVPLNYLKEGRMTSLYGYPAGVGLFLAPVLAMFFGLIVEKLKALFEPEPHSASSSTPRLPSTSSGNELVECRLKESSWLRGQSRGQSLKLKATTKNLKLKQPTDAPIYWGKYFKIFVVVMIIFSTVALLATKTEGAYLGVIIAIFLILMFTPWRKFVIIFSLILATVILAIPPSRHYVIQKATFSDVSGDVRLVLWQGTFRALKSNPIFGGGLSGFPDLYKQYKERKHIELLKYPHNIILNFWVETGILGLFAFLWLVFEFFKKIQQSYKLQATPIPERSSVRGTTSYKLAIAAAMLALLIYGLLDVPYFKNDLAILFWILVGLALI